MTLDDLFKQREATTQMQYIRFRDVRFVSAIPNRVIDWDHVQQLRAGNVHQLPALDVMFVSNGGYYELLDGQHRWWSIAHALEDARPEIFGSLPETETWDDFIRVLRGCLSRIDDTIQARVWPEMPAHEVRLIRFWKNRDHGLGASNDDRKETARALKAQNPLLTLEQIAREVRRSSTFVAKALNETGLKEEKTKTPDGLKDTRRFCNLVERLYIDGFILRDQSRERQRWLREDKHFCDVYEGIARQMLKDVEAARK